MPTRRPLVRFLAGVGLLAGGSLAVVGGLSLRGPGLVAVGVAGALAACLGWGMAREASGPRRRSAAETAVLAAAWTVGVLLALSGASVLAGGAVAALLAGGAAAVALVVWVVRSPREPAQRPASSGAAVPPDRAHPSALSRAEGVRREAARGAARVLPPVTALGTESLGLEWLESTAALSGRLHPADRASVVLRRQEVLDELERRDPTGFTRWLAAGPDTDPAGFVRGRAGEAAGESSAGTA